MDKILFTIALAIYSAFGLYALLAVEDDLKQCSADLAEMSQEYTKKH